MVHSRELELPEAFFVLLPEQYHNNIENLVGKTSLPDLLSQIKIMDVLVTGDTGPLHLAIALQIPTVSLFVTADPKWTGPYQDLHLHTVINKVLSVDNYPMELIKVDEVLDVINKKIRN